MFTLQEVVKRTGIGYRRIYDAQWLGKLEEPSVHRGRLRLYTEEDIRKVKEYFASRPAKGKK